jgi:hypothetical protein
MHNALFWAGFIQDVFLPQILALQETVFNRLLPAFDRIDQEAEEASRRAYEQFASRPGPDTDLADIAEAAHEAGVDRYLTLVGIRQGVLNLFAVALHHLVEQQQLVLLRKELRSRRDEDREDLLNVGEFLSRLQAAGIDPTAYEVWDTLCELRNVANVVKHAEGRSAEALRSSRPDLFQRPSIRGDDRFGDSASIRYVYQHLSGDDLYVTPDDLERYFDAAIAFWEAIIRDLRELHRESPQRRR